MNEKVKSFIRKTIILALFIIVIWSAGCSRPAASSWPTISKGKTDLSSWDFQTQGNIKLDGEWDFFWQRLLTYAELPAATPDLRVEVPNSWNSYFLQGKYLPGQGFATYRLHVQTGLPAGTGLGLRINTISSAYKLYINDKLVASAGQVAASAAGEIGQYKPQAVTFNIPGSDFDIILQVSNHQYARGGLWYSLYLGDAKGIKDFHDALIIKESFLLGTLIIIALFFAAVYFLRRDLSYTLYFALLCLAIAVSIDMVGQFIILRIFPGLSFNGIILLWYTAVSWMVFLVLLYVHELFPSKFGGYVLKVYFCIDSTFQLIFIFTAPIYYSKLAFFCNYLDIAGIACLILIVIQGVIRKMPNGWLNLISMLIVGVSYIYDSLYVMNVFNFRWGEIYYLGLFLFIFLQMVVQAQRIKSYHEQRTAAELAFLQAQIKPHFLFNALNTFISISHYDVDKARHLLADLSQYLKRSFDFRDTSHFVPLKHEIELAKAYVAIEKARFEERLEVLFTVQADLEIRVPRLILQPLIENAIIHGILPKPEGGQVNVTISQEADRVLFKVADNGIGLPESKLNSILQPGNNKGVGLANINARLRNLCGNGLEISSRPGWGTEFTFYMPIKRGRIRQDD